MRVKLSLETLKDVDYGKPGALFTNLIRQAVRDILDRPGERHPRKVTLQLEITPLVLQDGDVIDAEVLFSGKTSLPPYHTAARPMAIDRQGHLVFSTDAPDNPRQKTLDETATTSTDED
jgi:hypothetical protein